MLQVEAPDEGHNSDAQPPPPWTMLRTRRWCAQRTSSRGTCPSLTRTCAARRASGTSAPTAASSAVGSSAARTSPPTSSCTTSR
eukprot:1180076-Prorocentrum_minimum.AAC.1